VIGGLNTFRNRVHLQLLGQGDDGIDDGDAIWMLRIVEIAHEAPIDFDGIERETAQIAERGVRRAEVIQRDLDAKLPQLVKSSVDPGFIAQQDRSVISSSSRRGSSPLASRAPLTTSYKSSFSNWAGETLTVTLTWPGQLDASRQAWRSAHLPISTIRPVCSASGMKSPGEIVPSSG
jgi:hypothetical protein